VEGISLMDGLSRSNSVGFVRLAWFFTTRQSLLPSRLNDPLHEQKVKSDFLFGRH
jgi:hypothetical protein